MAWYPHLTWYPVAWYPVQHCDALQRTNWLFQAMSDGTGFDDPNDANSSGKKQETPSCDPCDPHIPLIYMPFPHNLHSHLRRMRSAFAWLVWAGIAPHTRCVHSAAPQRTDRHTELLWQPVHSPAVPQHLPCCILHCSHVPCCVLIVPVCVAFQVTLYAVYPMQRCHTVAHSQLTSGRGSCASVGRPRASRSEPIV